MRNMPEPLWPTMLPVDQQGCDELCAVSAHGVRIRFADGRELLCGTSGLWNANLGYGNPAIADAAADALRNASYLSVYRAENIYARQAAAALIDICGSNYYGRVLFSTSGGAANDLVIKVARHYHALCGDSRRKGVVGLYGGWHGLTYGAFALTSANLGHQIYGVDRRMIAHVSPNDPAELRTALAQHGDKVAAMVVEPVLGTGAVPLTETYVAELLRLRREHGFLLVADEVATGFGRAGTFFASERWPERPDMVITSKGLTNGTSACSAVIVSNTVARAFTGSRAVLGHGETQAGTPVSCATILATIAEMRRLDAVAAGVRLSTRLEIELSRMVADEPMAAATTGMGCLRSLRLRGRDGTPLPGTEVMAVIAAIREAGAIVHAAPDGIQLIPALIYTDEDLDELLGCVRIGLTRYAQRTSYAVVSP